MHLTFHLQIKNINYIFNIFLLNSLFDQTAKGWDSA